MAKRGIQWVFELIDRGTAPARRISKALGGVQKAGESLGRKGSTFGNALAKSLGVSERQAQRLAAGFRAMGSASSSFQTIRMRAQRLGSTLAGLRRMVFNLPNLIIGSAIGFAGKSFIDQMGFIEQQRIALGTLLNDPIRGNAALRWAINFADVTPFETTGVLESLRNALAMGFSTRQIEPLLTTLGDTASSLSLGPGGLNDLIMVFGQIKAAGKLMTQDVYQLTNRGIAAFDILAKGMDVSVADIRKMLEQGELTSDRALAILFEGLKERYGGGMQAQSKSLFGLVSTVVSRVTTFAAAAADQGALDPIKRVFENLAAATDTNSATGQQLVQRVASAVKALGEGTFGRLAEMLEPERIGATIDRVLAWLDKLKSWWEQNAPAIIAQARRFAAGVGQGLGDVLDILHVLGGAARGLAGLFQPLATAQAGAASQSTKLFGRLAIVGLALRAINALTFGLAGTVVRWAVPALLTLGRAALVAMGPWGWLALAAITAITLIVTHWDKIGPWLAKQWEKIKQVGAAVWARITDAAKSAWQWFKALPGRLWAALGRMWDRVVSAATSAWQWIVDQVFVAWDWLRGIPDNLRQWFANLWQRLLEHTQAAWSAITGAIQGALDTFREFVRAISNWQPPEWWQRFTPSGIASTGADQAFQSFAAGQLSGLGLSDVPAWLDPARTLPLFKFSESVGKELVNGIISGAISSEPALRRAFTGLTDRTTELVRDQYEIRSPSKVFEKIGRHLSLGLGRGVASGQAFATRAVTGMAAATLASAAVAAPPARQGGTVQVQIVINDARDPDRVLEQIRKQFPALVADAFEQLAMEEGVDG